MVALVVAHMTPCSGSPLGVSALVLLVLILTDETMVSLGLPQTALARRKQVGLANVVFLLLQIRGDWPLLKALFLVLLILPHRFVGGALQPETAVLATRKFA